ncbi:MAG TPA: carbohydrate ABC transporter permease [Clostridiales bacterium]|nr:carbohydrate ABC transporter permease [Clostridiales bacterium]
MKKIFFIYFPALLIISFILLPYFWTLLTSVKPTSEMFVKEVIYWPSKFTFENYYNLLFESRFLASLFNSLKVSLATSVVSIFASMLAAYVFARYNFKGNKIILGSILLLYMFPSVLYLMPLYSVFNKLGILGNIYSLVIAYTTTTIPYGIWLLTGYIREIPLELEEAARIDGANTWRTFFMIVFPLIRPGMVAAGSFIFITSWNEYLYAVMFTTAKSTTLSVMLSSLVREYTVSWDLLTSGGILAVLPVALLFFFMQKHLVSGLSAGSVKG